MELEFLVNGLIKECVGSISPAEEDVIHPMVTMSSAASPDDGQTFESSLAPTDSVTASPDGRPNGGNVSAL